MPSMIMNFIINKAFPPRTKESLEVSIGDDPEEIRKERALSEAMAKRTQLPRSIQVEKFSIQDELPVEKLVSRKGTPNGTLLYFHGGGYCAFSVATHKNWLGIITALANITTYMPEYRLAPENPFPAALDDAFKSYTWLLEQQGLDPRHVMFGGDSAGGGLALALQLKCKAENCPLPAGAVLFSPWTDLTNSGPSLEAKALEDPFILKSLLVAATRRYLGDQDPTNPYISPLFGDLGGLPPIQLHVGTREVLMDDSLRLAQKIKDAGGEIDLHVWEGMIHVFEFMESVKPFGHFIPESKKANRMAAQFIRKILQP